MTDTDTKRRFILLVDVKIDVEDLDELADEELEGVWDSVSDGLYSLEFEEAVHSALQEWYVNEIANVGVVDVRSAPQFGERVRMRRNGTLAVVRKGA